MRKIPYLVKSATVAEITDVSGVVASAIGEAALGDTHLNTRVQDLNQLNTDMLRGMAKGRTKELSAPLNTADSLRDNLFRALIHFLKALIYWNKPETAPAAELLMAEINKQGTGLSKLSQEKESAHIDALLQAFQSPALAQALVTTNLVSLNNRAIKTCTKNRQPLNPKREKLPLPVPYATMFMKTLGRLSIT